MKFTFIRSQRLRHAVAVLCRLLGCRARASTNPVTVRSPATPVTTNR